MQKALVAAVLGVALAAGGPALAQSPPSRPSAERPILLIAQLRSGPVGGDVAEQLRPLKTMAEVEAFLTRNSIAYERGRIQVDRRKADPKLLEGIDRLPPGEIFVIPAKDGLLFNQVLRALTPDAAKDMENW